ncbi:hypothetical protein KFZ70_13850 [Tamlana fucoidanivorans]|uniref:Uncharacterized protein n=1 Tax=Allotamlana fucoidanivorans TaxID=2583814 RepID=A0A5C4SSC3_9FLAO|nr:hypothetical protein [Tamlana fucoidanivorans]TNJ46511.1 hypothetical protein FGF67_02465 [Tamlana fucoidanivorans]
MNDFLLEHYNAIYSILEGLSAITALICYKKYRLTTARYFIWFLVYLTICDYANNYVHHIQNGFFSFLQGTKLVRNYWWTTIYWKVGAILFFAFYYYMILQKKRFKQILKYAGCIFLGFSVIYIIWHWEAFFKQFFPIISVLGAVIIFLCTMFYFIEVLQSDKILTFYKSLNFYISAAIFIWWLIITPLVFYDIYNAHFDWNFIFLKWEIYLFANLCMYLTFTFALIWCKPQNE